MFEQNNYLPNSEFLLGVKKDISSGQKYSSEQLKNLPQSFESFSTFFT